MDAECRVDPDEVLVERPVVDRAEAESVAYDGFAGFLGVADDVRRVEQPHFA